MNSITYSDTPDFPDYPAPPKAFLYAFTLDFSFISPALREDEAVTES